MIVPGQSAPAAGSAVAGSPLPKIADHELLRVIGRGAYGEVWLARHTRLSTLRAIKIIRRDQLGDARPFTREFDGIQKYEPISRSHPNLVSILHVGGTDDCFYYVMELADDANVGQASSLSGPKGEEITGETGWKPVPLYSPHTLRSELKQHGAVPIDRCLDIAHALASALAHLHAHKLVHRDVKPSNIIFVGGVPKLADIGLVAGVDDARSFVGTEGYVPPEGPGAPSADCYSLGKLLYELSTGHDRTAWPEPPADLARRPDRERLLELNAILHRACAPDPRHRYASAEAMLAEIELLQGGQSVKRRRTIRQRRAVCKKAGVGLAVLAVLATGVVILLQRLLRSELSSDGPPSTNMLANTLCAKAMLIIRGDNYAAFSEAYTNFNKAIVLDPNFARAYVGLLDLRSREFAPSLEPMTPQAMRDIAAKLKQLVPNLHSTYSADAEISWSDWDFTKAERFYLQAIKAAPDDERGHSGYGYYLMTVGRPIEARAHLEISLKLAPSKVTIFRVIGQSYHAQRDYTHAIEYYRKALELEPHHFVAYNMIGLAQVAMGDYPAAITNFEKGAILSGADEAETKQDSEDLRRALREGGVRGYWQELWKRTEKKPNDDFYSKAIIQNQLGETEEAFKWLNKSYETHERIGSGYETWLNYLLWHHWWDGLHDDPGFKALLDKVGFTKVMPARK